MKTRSLAVVFQQQVAAGQVDGQARARSCRGARPTAATAEAPVPQAQVSPEPRSQVRWMASSGLTTWTNSTFTLRGEEGMGLDEGADLLHGEVRHVVHVDDAMGIAHGHRAEGEGAAADLEGLLQHLGRSKVVGIFRPAQMGSPMSMRTSSASPAASRLAMRAMRQPAPVMSFRSSLPRA